MINDSKMSFRNNQPRGSGSTESQRRGISKGCRRGVKNEAMQSKGQMARRGWECGRGMVHLSKDLVSKVADLARLKFEISK